MPISDALGRTDSGARVAVVFSVPAGVGGLGMQVATVLDGLSRCGLQTIAIGPKSPQYYGTQPREWMAPPDSAIRHMTHSLSRVAAGHAVGLRDVAFGRWAAKQLELVRPDAVYCFTQVALESLKWARSRRIPSIVDNPNCHIRDFRAAYVAETERYGSGRYLGHPARWMLRRIQAEYELAEWVRVSSELAKQSMTDHGVPAAKIYVVPQSVDYNRFTPPTARVHSGALRIRFCGTLDVRKGFVYLLNAMHQLSNRTGVRRCDVEALLIGGTADRLSRILLERHVGGLKIKVSPGNPIPALQDGEVFVLPSLEDGFGFAAAEAMACGLPAIVTNRSGVAEWVGSDGGWVVQSGDAEVLAEALELCLVERHKLDERGATARESVIAHSNRSQVVLERFSRTWFGR